MFKKLGLSLILVLAFSFLGGTVQAADSDLSILPTGELKPALAIPHFPNKSCAFVWRNWNLIKIENIAKTLKTEPEKVKELAALMGLPKYQEPKWTIPQIYITLIRRNWHLLPYEQLTEFLEMTPEKLAFNLKEDDFLFHKLGLLKPVCEPIKYSEPTETERTALRKIAEIVRSDFGETPLDAGEEPRFHFLEELKKVDPTLPPVVAEKSRFTLRYLYSYFALFGDPLLAGDEEIYPDGLFQKLAHSGVNGVWLHVVLRDLVPGGELFPEFGQGHEQRIEHLKKLVLRAKKYGIDIFLYMNEPRAMPKSFFEKHPELRGAWRPYLNVHAICTSHPATQKWLSDSLAYLFKEVPGLGGVFTITASENFTNCASHGEGFQSSCPRCGKRPMADVVAEVNRLIAEGVHRSAPDAKVIVWDWGWSNGAPEVEQKREYDVLRQLPKNVWVMTVSERGIKLNRGGVSTTVGEYSISAVGPSDQSRERWKKAEEFGLKRAAKVQFNSTWEIASVPYIPAMDLVAQHCSKLTQCGVDILMMSWSLGGYPSMNLRVPNYFDRDPVPSVSEVLDELALELYGKDGASMARAGWSAVSQAFEEFPFSGSQVVYNAPLQSAPAEPFYLTRTGYHSTMVGIPYDDLKSWCAKYPSEIFAEQFEKMEKGFHTGAAHLERAASRASEQNRREAYDQARYASAVGDVYESVAHHARFIMLRDQLATAGSDQEKAKIKKEMIQLLQEEINLAKNFRKLTLRDSRIGFESTNHYWFVPNDLVEKVISCRSLIEELSR